MDWKSLKFLFLFSTWGNKNVAKYNQVNMSIVISNKDSDFEK